LEDLAEQLGIDVERRTTRGRACPRCGGKIIPSIRAVYQNASAPNAVFPAWQCERCGYEELNAQPVKPAAKHASPAAEKKAAAAQNKPSGVVAAGTGSSSVTDRPPATRAVPALKDRKGRALPPDVNRMVDEMTRTDRTEGTKQ
jgi:DNA-directed RNA polymerase subunit RPC12/RpoP